MKNPITTKDMLVLNELILFEQWAMTKFRHYYDAVGDKPLKKVMKDICIKHSNHHQDLFGYMNRNAESGGEK